MTDLSLLEKIKSKPHYRIAIRPEHFKPDLMPNLKACVETIEHTKVSLRGWDYPYLSREEQEREYGSNWIASWANFCGMEYWRFFQSGQFIHYLGVSEKINLDWEMELRSTLKRHLSFMKDLDFSTIPGVMSISGIIYTITEIFEFVIRLCQKEVYTDLIVIEIALNNAAGFALVADNNRAWHSLHQAPNQPILKEWKIQASDLMTSGHDLSMEAILWFFERFGWLNPSLEILKRDQERFLAG